MTLVSPRWAGALLLCAAFAFPQSASAKITIPTPGRDKVMTEVDCASMPCTEVLPGAARFEPVPDKPWFQGLDDAGEAVGWVVLSTSVVDIKGYSGKPMATLIGVDPGGLITGGRVVQHSEPILLVGIPEEKLTEFVDAYRGLHVLEKVVLGGAAGPDERSIDIVSGATVTVLAENRTILDTSRALAEAVGVIEPRPAVPGHFIEDAEPLSWAELTKSKALGHLLVTHEDMGIEGGTQPFVDLWYGIADAPHVGIPLLGETTWRKSVEALASDEHLLVVLGNGSSSFKGSGFVRGGIFDRVRVEQGLRVLMFRDLDYKNFGAPVVADAPEFKETALFVARGGGLDPGASFDFVFLGSAFDLKGGFSREFHTFKSTSRTPKSVYVLDGPDPEAQVWRGAWASRPFAVGFVALWFLLLAGVFAARRWTAGSMHRLERLHLVALVVAFVVLGLVLRVQPSVTQVLTAVGSLVGEWRWGFFLSDPFLFVSWIFIAAMTLVWGRGVFCGWACPYGALNELLFKLGKWLKVPQYELPDSVHNKLRHLRYVILFLLIGTYLWSPEVGEQMAEVEPFKSTFFVPPWTRHWALATWWVALLVVSVFMFRPFCRYVCPLGGALALPSSFRLSGPHRRDFCHKGCNICPTGCEPRAIRKDSTIDARECLNCWECEANYNDDEVCPPLIQIRRVAEKQARKAAS